MGKKKARAFARIITCLAATAAIALGTASPAFAVDEVTDSVGTSNINVTVPTTIPCTMMADGTVVAPSGLSIMNSGDAVVVDAYTADAMGNAVDFTLDIGGTRALSRTGGKDEPALSPIKLKAGSEGSLTLSVSKLSHSNNANLIDRAANGVTGMFRLGFNFDTTTLADKAAINIEGTPNVGSTLTANVTGLPQHAQMSYQWYRKKTESVQHLISSTDDLDLIGALSVEVPEHGEVIIKVTNSSGAYVGADYQALFNNDIEVPYTSVRNYGETQEDQLYVSVCEYTYELSPGLYYMRPNPNSYTPLRKVDAYRVVDNEIDEAIEGATGSTYDIQSGDEGYFIYCKAIDVSGNYSGELVSETVGPVVVSAKSPYSTYVSESITSAWTQVNKKGEIQSIATSSDDIVGQVLITSHGEASDE